MTTKFDIGQEVMVKAKVKKIVVNNESDSPVYRLIVYSANGVDPVWANEKDIIAVKEGE